MRHIGVIAAREVRSLFVTPAAYVLLAGYAVLAGYFFFVGLGFFVQRLQQVQQMQMFDYLQQMNLNSEVIGPSFGSFSVILVFLIPLITMRTFAEERVNGTFELLLTSPLSTWEIVLGKYLGVLGPILAIVAISACYPALLLLYGNPEILQTLAGLLGLFCYGATLGAIGCFASALTQNQIVAAVVAMIVGLMLYLLEFLAQLTPPGAGQELIRYLGLSSHFQPALEGVVRTQDLVYYAIVVTFLLTVMRTAIESLRWR
ncbi:MAG: ABC transporter permease subunit [Myxococcota bacterium]|nr:ABC transporter permease subunit [Myxococcota bacterium]